MSLDQGQKVLVKAEGKTVYLPCKVTDLQSWNYVHWYQMKDGEAPSRLLYISQKGDATRDTNNPQANDFTVDKTKLYDLKLSNTQKSHAAVYFCSYWDSSSGHSEKIYSHTIHELKYTYIFVFCLIFLFNLIFICTWWLSDGIWTNAWIKNHINRLYNLYYTKIHKKASSVTNLAVALFKHTAHCETHSIGYF